MKKILAATIITMASQWVLAETGPIYSIDTGKTLECKKIGKNVDFYEMHEGMKKDGWKLGITPSDISEKDGAYFVNSADYGEKPTMIFKSEQHCKNTLGRLQEISKEKIVNKSEENNSSKSAHSEVIKSISKNDIESAANEIGFITKNSVQEFKSEYKESGCSNMTPEMISCSSEQKSICSTSFPKCSPSAYFVDNNLVGFTYEYNFGEIDADRLKAILDKKYGYADSVRNISELTRSVSYSSKWTTPGGIYIGLNRLTGIQQYDGKRFDYFYISIDNQKLKDKEKDFMQKTK